MIVSQQRPRTLLPWLAIVLAAATSQPAAAENGPSPCTKFPSELVDWTPGSPNPILTAAGPGHWDVKIRERGWILRENGVYQLWYTGYDGTREGVKHVGLATSCDGLHWTRRRSNPIYRDHWVEDMMVVQRCGTYYMFAEGADSNHAVMLTSKDGVDWKWQGPLEVRVADGTRPVEKPCGTPTVWIEGNTWYLFYERHDAGVWLASSKDPCSRVWTNVQDDPVMRPGPASHDKEMIALNQVIKHQGTYYAIYHGSGDPIAPRKWNTNIARSCDLIHWEKHTGNPIVPDKSSGILVCHGCRVRLYTMHDQVDWFESCGR